MRKIYSLFLLMILSASSLFAQEPIEKVSELSNTKAYTITSARCGLQVIKDGTCLYTSSGSAAGVAEFNDKDPNQHFALINGGKNFFLYSVGAGKFVDKNGLLTDEVTADVVINLFETGNDNFPFNLNWGSDYYLNTQEPGNFDTGYIIDDWSTLDNGNRFQIIEAAAFTDEAAIKKAEAYDATLVVSKVTYIYMCDGKEQYRYTKTMMGAAPLTVEYDGPGNRIGASSYDSAPANKEISVDTEETVTYNFTIDFTSLPFTPTTIDGQEFAKGTKWYFLQPYDANTYCYSTDSGAKVKYVKSKSARPLDTHFLFTFTGDPLSGFQIYNYAKGATMDVYANNTDTYADVVFSATNTCAYFLEAGTADGQYRFNHNSNVDAYLNGYASELQLFTWGDGWASSDYGSQFIIAEATDKEIAMALTGVLTADPSYIDGYAFRGGSGLSSLQVLFEGTEDDAAITIAAGMETGKITLVDAEGNVVATPAYAVNAENPTLLDITFASEFNKEGVYYLVIAEGLVKGASSGLINPEIKYSYSFLSAYEEKIVTARIYKSNNTYPIDDYPVWSTLPYVSHDDGDYYTCKVKVLSQDTFVLLDWMNAGGEKDTLKVQFDTTREYYNVVDFNDIHTVDEYGSMWVRTSTILDPYGYCGCYMYPDGSDASMDEERGSCLIQCYTYGETSEYVYIKAEWYMDDRYAMREIVPGKVHASAFQELYYNDKDYPAFMQLPYDKETGTYDITVGIASDSTIVLQNYTGVSGENLTIVYDPQSGDVVNFNGLSVDEYGSCQIASSALDGVTGSWYAYVGSYSYVSYTPETKSGFAVISGYDDNLQSYNYLYVSIGDYTPTTDIKTVDALPATLGTPVIYNLTGQRLSAPRKGVNIINGKKVMRK